MRVNQYWLCLAAATRLQEEPNAIALLELRWSCACFFCLGASNVLLFTDLVIFPQVDLQLLRHSLTLSGLAMLLYGMISDTV